MRVIVCIKSVLTRPPDPDGGRSAVAAELNPYDRPALALGRELAGPDGEMIALTMGPEPAREALHDAIALGADRGVLLSDPAFAGGDTLATSRVLAAGLEKLKPFDLVLFGARTADSDTGQVGPQTATLLVLPLAARVTRAEPGAGSITVRRRVDGMREQLRLQLPAVLTVHPAAAPDQDLSLAALERSYRAASIEVLTNNQLRLDLKLIGLAGSPTRVREIITRTEAKKCEFIAGPPEEMAEKLVARLIADGLIG